MEAVSREDGDGEGQVGGVGGEGAAPPTQPPPLPLPLLHPRAVSSKHHRERHIVAWSQQEDDLLREQVGIHGTENWTCIAALFKDKTGRQCRRRWYSYLNTECKKGGWSLEEDMILCEAHRIFGNRWTEIAKVVSGRTDNAVKNRFTTLCKKRAKNEAISKENECFYAATNNENFGHEDGCIALVPLESSSTLKKIRYQNATPTIKDNLNERTLDEHKLDMENVRAPMAVLPNFDNVGGLPDHQHSANQIKSVQSDENATNNELQGSFSRKDDPKISALMQQAELLSSLAERVCMRSSERSVESAWKQLKDYLIQSGESGPSSSEVSEVDFLLDDVKDLTEGARIGSAGNHLSLRQSDIHKHSHLSCEIGSGSSYDSDIPADSKLLHADESAIQYDSKTQGLPEDGAKIEMNTSHEVELPNGSLDSTSAAIMSPCNEAKQNDGIISVLSNTDFSSPLQTVPIFMPFSEANPSPKFSASERQFLLSALGLSSPLPSINSPSQQPSCKKALLHSL